MALPFCARPSPEYLGDLGDLPASPALAHGLLEELLIEFLLPERHSEMDQ